MKYWPLRENTRKPAFLAFSRSKNGGIKTPFLLLALGLLGCPDQYNPEGIQKSAYSAESEVIEESSWPTKPPYQLKYETLRRHDPSIDEKIEDCFAIRWRFANQMFFNPKEEIEIQRDLREACKSLVIQEY